MSLTARRPEPQIGSGELNILAGSPDRLSLLASCFAGQRVPVLAHDGPSHFDGEILRLAELSTDEQVFAVVAQAAMVGGGSFDAGALRRLGGRPGPARRYFALELVRTTSLVRNLVPRTLAELLTPFWDDGPADSLAASLDRAFGVGPVPDVPAFFGELRAKEVLRSVRGQSTPPQPNASARTPARHQPPEADDDSADADDQSDDEQAERSALLRLLSSPLSPGNVARRLLGSIVPMRRRADPSESGSGGIEVPVGRRGAPKSSGSRSRAASAGSLGATARGVVDGVYPEWDDRMGQYREAWCSVGEFDVPALGSASGLLHPDSRLPRRLARVGLDLEGHRRQVEGDDLDVDALVEHSIDRATGVEGDDRIHRRRLPTGRDLSVFVLLDASGSNTSGGMAGQSVFEQHVTVAHQLVSALHTLGARTALFGFNSYGRHSVRLLRVKDFTDQFDETAMRRLTAVEPGGFTRFGAAVRHATQLASAGGTTNRLLVVLSDGVPFDDGYEQRYAQADSRRALSEARRFGVGAVCISAAPTTPDEDLDRVFGGVPHIVLRSYDDLPAFVGPTFLTSLRDARSQRREDQTDLSRQPNRSPR